MPLYVMVEQLSLGLYRGVGAANTQPNPGVMKMRTQIDPYIFLFDRVNQTGQDVLNDLGWDPANAAGQTLTIGGGMAVVPISLAYFDGTADVWCETTYTTDEWAASGLISSGDYEMTVA